MPTCAIYARVSTDKQIESVDNQISFLSEYAKRQKANWIIPEQCIYRDDGISGTSIEKRQAVQQMIMDGAQGRFEIVLFKGISRFARDTVDALNMLRNLRAARVRVISLEEGFDSLKSESDELFFTIHASMAQFESSKIGIRTRIGQAEIAKRGRWPNGKQPFGYSVNAETRILEINHDEADIVRLIFDMYTNQGKGMWSIAQYLNSHGLYTRENKLWTQGTIKYVLNNATYTGKIVYGARVYEDKYDIEEKRIKTERVQASEEEKIVVEETHEAIVNEETFQFVQQIMISRRNRRIKGEGHLLTGILKCPKCGTGMVGAYQGKGKYNKDFKYACANRHRHGKSVCDQKSILGSHIESIVLNFLSNELSDRQFEDIRNSTVKNQNVSKLQPEELLKRVENEIAEIKRQMANANLKNVQGVIDDETLQIVMDELNKKRKVFSDEQTQLNLIIQKKISVNEDSDIFLQAVKKFKKLRVDNEDDRTKMRVLLPQLIDRIDISDEKKVHIKLKFNTH